MRNLVLFGILIAGLGVFLLARGGVFTTHRHTLMMGDVTVTADQHQSAPPWIGAAVVLLGVGVIVAGVRQRA